MRYYDVLCKDCNGIIRMSPLILAISEADAMHLAEIKSGGVTLDATLSLDVSVYI